VRVVVGALVMSVATMIVGHRDRLRSSEYIL
jgi:hypothetical protein